MESKLPKPSGLKRPTPVTKTILPTERIKAATISGFGFSTKAAMSASGIKLFNTELPLTRDLTNLPGFKRRERAVSPEMHRPKSPTRVKLRRSRSACDIRDVKPMKRAEPTLAPIPAKSARMGFGGGSTANLATTTTAVRPPRVVGGAPAAASTTTRKFAASTSRAAIGRTTTTVAGGAKKLANSKPTSISTTGAGKAINKRIPPYDFKARYNDLLEKHKLLKEKYETKCEQMGSLEGMPEQLEESQTQLFAALDELKHLQTDNDCLNRQIKGQTSKIDSLTSSLAETTKELNELREKYHKIIKEHASITAEVVKLRESSATLTESNGQLSAEMDACKDQLFRSNIERRELHNTIMDLRGNIRVFCRVRPQLPCEQERLMCGWNYLDEATVEIHNPELLSRNKPGTHTFNFDQVFHSGSSQEDIFEMVSPLIQSALDGYNVCIFAYGQTGSGKTFTMDGVPSQAGVIPRTVDLLFESVANYRRLGWTYEIRVTFLEIYNEVLYDLLSNEAKDMEIRISKTNKNDIYVSNITQETVVSAARLRQLMQIATMNRATASTAGNERSSRSHAVTKIELIGTHEAKNETSVGTINLVDLAGSESPKTSVRMNETKNINRSLSELTNVILALLQKQDHIPYRNSKLTHLLMPSLGGNSKTLMFINVAPLLDCYVESVKSLRFAATVNSCKMAKAKRNRFLNTSVNSSNAGSLDR